MMLRHCLQRTTLRCRRELHHVGISAACLFLLVSADTAGRSQGDNPINGQSVALSVRSARPISDVLDQIQERFVLPLTFEELPFQNDADLPMRNNVDTGSGRYKLFVGPPIGNFAMKIPGGTGPYEAALAILSGYQAAKLPGVYKAIQHPSRIDIVPSQVLNRAGQWVQVTPLMSQLVNLQSQTRTLEDFFQAVVSQVSLQSGMNVTLLAQPYVRGEQTQLGATNESAADVISSVGDSMKTKLTFRCLYDPTNNVYYLRINIKPVAHVLPVAGSSNPANGPKSLIDPSKASHNNSPYLVKDH